MKIFFQTSRVLAAAVTIFFYFVVTSGSATAGHLIDVRFGRHGTLIRAVLDLDVPVSFTQATAADGLSVTLTLSETKFDKAETRTLDKLPPLTGYRIGPGTGLNSGTVVFLSGQPIHVANIQAIDPGKQSKRHRIVIDIEAAPVSPTLSSPASPRPSAVSQQTPLPTTSPLPSPLSDESSTTGRLLEIPPELKTGFTTSATPITPLAPVTEPSVHHGPSAAELARIETLLARAQKLSTDSPDYSQAMALYREAADLGSPAAAFAIGQMYRLGAGMEANNTLAAFWYGEAARTGFPPAEMNLGVMHLRGLGLHPDPAAGLALIRRAAGHGNQPARDLLEEIRRAERRSNPGAASDQP